MKVHVNAQIAKKNEAEQSIKLKEEELNQNSESDSDDDNELPEEISTKTTKDIEKKKQELKQKEKKDLKLKRKQTEQKNIQQKKLKREQSLSIPKSIDTDILIELNNKTDDKESENTKIKTNKKNNHKRLDICDEKQFGNVLVVPMKNISKRVKIDESLLNFRSSIITRSSTSRAKAIKNISNESNVNRGVSGFFTSPSTSKTPKKRFYK
ncbi:hypothetical protein BC833DRAFT_619401 [Globomyces pollinis-pini]|nr:hypothetical protein BC833DRAFT_619401 [Globomyces pollinis-pini]